MAEGAVALLITKLGFALAKEAATFGASLLCKEASALKGLFGEIREAKEELESMQAYLQGAERFKDTDETTRIFVNKIRGFAFEIEDVVDEFTYKLEDKQGGFIKRMKKRVKHIKVWRQLTIKLQGIKGRLHGADTRKVRYDMRGIERNNGHSGSADRSLNLAREEDLVGIKENKDKLMHWLVGDLEEPGSKIATIWGMGGVGKTTLVHHVYKAVKMDFNISVWISVSSSYQVEGLLKKIASKLGIPIANANENRSLVEVISNHLKGSNYLIILDDVWNVDVWFKIRIAFPTESTGRFVITTRIQEVALLATKTCTIKLEPLERDYAWQLFCNEAFWNNENKTCPEELEDLGKMFLNKCGGLPIAIACVGRLLSCRHQTYSQWESLYKELELQLSNNVRLNVNIVLKVSLEGLPTDLKNCFLHCTIFPEDYLFRRKVVIRHWIAAGYIKETGSKTLEEVAEGYLNELVNRSLLQVVQRNPCGRVRRCRMHDIIRVLALAKSEEESFCQVYNGSRPLSTENTRRLSVQNTNMEQLTPLLCATSLRSLHVFTNHLSTDSLEAFLKPFNLLSTLDLQGVKIKRLPKIVFNLFNLRFLGLRETLIEYLPKEIGRLQNLEVLDAYFAMLLALPVEVATLWKLKYLYVVTFPARAYKSVPSFDGFQGPKGIGNLTDLLALQAIEASSEVLCQLGCLTKLRTFGITKVRSGHCADLCGAITKMVHLIHVAITAIDGREVLQLESLSLPPTVSKLEIAAQLDKRFLPQFISSISTLTNLISLQLGWSKLYDDSFACLLGLPGLVKLVLAEAYEGNELHFPATSLPKLKSLQIWDAPNLSRVTIEQGAMQNIAKLFLRDCPELKHLPDGIEYLRTLEYLELKAISKELTWKLQQNEESKECDEDWMKISHVRRVDVL
ncbi:disease resistance protein RPM1-like [Aegilops tauschii subsp. strangulata]|uniref:Disease resistance protein RPM1 n=1 Tax=Aegilops tauschii subsp. strangulata TaxID=200361 RepID=A0A453DP39_AEGTS|nr:disease resistance protein RPM1-like [Aegilops tauschii subsp. strangulata]